jgi:phosphoribosyl-ATP pyrophosphohydrolase
MKPGLYETLERIAAVISERKGGDTTKSYVARLLAESEDAILRKIGEEAIEVILAAKSGEQLEVVRETADLWFHCLILLARKGLGPADILAELHRREGISGIDEKAARRRNAKEAGRK